MLISDKREFSHTDLREKRNNNIRLLLRDIRMAIITGKNEDDWLIRLNAWISCTQISKSQGTRSSKRLLLIPTLLSIPVPTNIKITGDFL